ncbi:hypothetical protein [Rhodococcus sp. NPDC058521]|uniref:hypothetical protein n=1 Tax=Rhodococcus sp. NPDC058521 TaxID=3346536 RepID=UPI00364AAC6F
MNESRELPRRAGGIRRVRPWEKVALVGLVAAVGSVLVFTAVAGGEADAGSTVSTERAAAVQQLLDSWGRAIRVGDTGALTGLLDPEAEASFVASEAARAANVSQLEFSDWGYELVAGEDHDVDAGLAARLGVSEVWAPTVRLRYAIDSVDAVPTRKVVSPTFVRRGDTWALLDGGESTRPATTWRGPWDYAPLVTREVETGGDRMSMILGHPDNEAMVDRLAEDIDSAVDDVSEVWGPEWSRGALVMVASSDAEFTSLVGADHDGEGIAAVAVSDAPTPGDPVVGGQRIVFSPASTLRLDDEARRSILRHELTHVAARAVTVDGSPMWLLEGYSEYVAHRGTGASAREVAPTLAAQIDAGKAPDMLPSNENFTQRGDHGSLAYETAWSINAFAADEFGDEELTDLYVALAKGSSRDEDVDRTLEEQLGVGTESFVERWSAWLDEQFA